MTYRPYAPSYGVIPRRSQKWYANPYGAAGATPMSLSRLYAMPFALTMTASFDAIGMDVTTVGSAGSVVRFGVYATDYATGAPGALIVDAGTVATASGTGAKSVAFASTLILQPGLYWLAAAGQVAAPSMRYCQGIATLISNDSAAPGAGPNTAFYIDSVAGALPTPFGTASPFGFGPIILLRAL